MTRTAAFGIVLWLSGLATGSVPASQSPVLTGLMGLALMVFALFYYHRFINRADND